MIKNSVLNQADTNQKNELIENDQNASDEEKMKQIESEIVKAREKEFTSN